MMQIRNTQQTYGVIAKCLHWLVALLIIALLIVGTSINYISTDAIKFNVINIHKSFGLLVLALVIIRIVWRFSNKTPELPLTTPRWQRRAARLSHMLIYIAILLMPISGIIMSTAAGYPPRFFGLFTLQLPIAVNKVTAQWFNQAHEILAWIILALVCIHILAALKHHFIDRDNVLKRML